MSDTPLQSTLRELRGELASPRTAGVMLAAIVLLVLSGPFGTLETLALPVRLAYWGCMVVLTFTVGNFFSTWMRLAVFRHGWRQPWRFVAAGLAAGLPASLIVLAINAATFGFDGMDARDVAKLFGYGITISIIVAGVFAVLAREAYGPMPDRDAAETAPRIMRRVPVERRGRLVSLSVQDHYVEVTTSRGTSMVLMRLGDAIDEAAPVAGLQIHRSHWVALDGVRAIRRRDGKVIVETDAGDSLPVSRSYLAAVRESGLIAG